MRNKNNFIVSVIILFLSVLVSGSVSYAAEISENTEVCLDCHNSITPGIVADWESSRHARFSPAEALNFPELERRISAESVPDSLRNISVGCAECHMLNADSHPGTFDHADYPLE